MRIVFRTDASIGIGTGHVMRCLTLADSLKTDGAECHFICRKHTGNLIDQIRDRGFPVFELWDQSMSEFSLPPAGELGVDGAPYSSWLGSNWSTDAEQTRVGAGETAIDWLIVDHYALDARWEQALRPKCRKLMVIDDLADRLHDCDLLLDQNLGRDESDYGGLVPKDCAVLVGPRYALLRPEFAALRDYSLHRRAIPKLEHLLITMGGVDQADATGQILEALKDCQLPEHCHITVVMGPQAPWLERVQLLAAQMPQPTEVKVNVHNMAQLMADSDLAIGAAGSTSWERCCLGLPSLIVVLAENQRQGAAALEDRRSAKVLGGVDAIPGVLRAMLSLPTQTDELRQLSEASCSITDGRGAGRVKRVLLERYG